LQIRGPDARISPIGSVSPSVWYGHTTTYGYDLATSFVDAAYYDYHHTSSTGTGKKACHTAALGSVILHKISHKAAGTNEKAAHLAQYYYLYYFRSDHGYTAHDCRALRAPRSWNKSDWGPRSDVVSTLNCPGTWWETTAASWRLGCGHGTDC